MAPLVAPLLLLVLSALEQTALLALAPLLALLSAHLEQARRQSRVLAQALDLALRVLALVGVEAASWTPQGSAFQGPGCCAGQGQAQGQDQAKADSLYEEEVRGCRRLGQGAYGVVFADGGEAVKVMSFEEDPRLLRCFQREHHIMRECSRSSRSVLCPSAFQVSPHTRQARLRMPLCQGGSVRSLLRDSHGTEGAPVGLPLPLALGLVLQTAQALAAVHAAGFCHFDVKPDNILLTRRPAAGADSLEGCVRLADFGLALGVGECVSMAGGTRGYKAPELAPGREGVALSLGPAADVFSLGATLVELLLGGLPGAHPEHREQMQASLRALPPETHDLAQRMLHPDARQRPTAQVAQLIRDQGLRLEAS